ncbi:MAG: hypothetical protein VB143_06585 [Burkholderia sp.]
MATAISGKIDISALASAIEAKKGGGPLPKDAGMQALGALMQGPGQGHRERAARCPRTPRWPTCCRRCPPGSFHQA